MENYCLFIALLFAPTITQSFTKTVNSTITDKQALLAFKNTITSDPHSILGKNWTTYTPICNWIGVTCSIKNHRVTGLNVSGFELGVSIAPHLGNLTFLQSLDISFNNFTGEIPSWLGTLSQLQHVNFNSNIFSGRIPPSFFNISGLRTLDLGFNFLDGNVPDEISNISSLETVILEVNQLEGSIPDGLFSMFSLEEINMRYNRLSGELPNEMCNNTKLKRIYLKENRLFGEIPTKICNCRELEDLVLSLNSFNSSIPSEIGSLPKLKFLSLWANNFQGPIPKQLGNLTSLEYLALDSNNLRGELPIELANLENLNFLSVDNNSLSGSLPYPIFNMSNLTLLALSQNNFWGSLPPNMGLSLPNLQELYLHFNRFSGPIPASINNASKLTLLELDNNSFSGSIPNFGNLRNLTWFSISGNNLTGAESPNQELEFLSSLTNSVHLNYLLISNNPLNGALPPSIGNLSASLEKISAYGCNIKGVIPSEIGNLSSLLGISLQRNQISGLIPTTLGKLEQLQRLDLSENMFQGHISNELCRIRSLAELDLSGNSLTGPIPECFGEMKGLRLVILASNKMNSTLPSTFWSLSDLVSLDLSSNNLSGQISSSIGSLKTINKLNLSFNQFSGSIPSSIGGCQSLETISLSSNKFEGSIPSSLGEIRGLSSLDLSSNNFSGFIPISLTDLDLLHLNLSSNMLEGEIPNKGCFLNFSSESFLPNYALCGTTRFQVPPCSKNHKRLRRIILLMRYILPFFAFALLLVMIILLIKCRRIETRILPPPDVVLGLSWRRVSYTELEKATQSFSETNLLGKGSFGSVFKGTLSDGLNVAVKVFNLEMEGSTKSFDTETQALSTIRHRNLVRVIGYCMETEFKALILAYMPNGSLDKWLHSQNYCLDLLQRLNIAIDVASALEYLHHGHTFALVHCDIKPSNVLLDEDMTAHVCDFGISKMFEDGNDCMLTKTLATIGYAAPEYGLEGKVSTSGDVYGYGIMLLEMFTRKKPTDDMFSEEMSLKDWVRTAMEENAVSDVVATDLISIEDQHYNEKVQCLACVLDLAMKCLAFSPLERINMIQAAAGLHRIKTSYFWPVI